MILRLIKEKRGVTAVEFALIAPFLLTMLIGMVEFAWQIYGQSVLQGAMQNAARISTLEGGDVRSGQLDDEVEELAAQILPSATFEFSRRNYSNFSDVRKPEDYTDTNGDGSCNDGEPFEDLNGNGTWDADRGRDGGGGARDAVLYEVVARYDRILPIHLFTDASRQVELRGSTVLRNQPFDEQAEREAVVGNCT